MHSTKTYHLLATFSAWELRGFQDLLDSPFFNKNAAVRALFAALLPSLRGETEGVPSKEEAFAAVFPGDAYQHQRLRYVMTDLTRLAETFMVQKSLEGSPELQTRLLLGALTARGLDKYFETAHGDAMGRLEADPLRDSAHLLQRFFLEEAGLAYGQARQNRNPDQWLLPTIESLQQFSLAARLKYVCELLNRRNILSIAGDDRWVHDVVRELELGHHSGIPAIAVYETIFFSLLHEDDPTHYQHLRVRLREHATAFSKSELGQLYAFALNYCIKRLNQGASGYLRELHSLYLELLEGRILHENEQLAPQHFKNIVTVAIRLEEFDWTEQFILAYKSDLPPGERENAFTYNMAALQFSRKAYGQAKRLLQQVVFTDPYYQLDARAILLKCYYELQDDEPLFSLIGSFRLFLRRNDQISDYQRKVYLNLVRFVEKIAKARSGGDGPSLAIIREIDATKEVADLAWLQRKLAELIPPSGEL